MFYNNCPPHQFGKIPSKDSLRPCHAHHPSHRAWRTKMTPIQGNIHDRLHIRSKEDKITSEPRGTKVRSSKGKTPMLDEAGEMLPDKTLPRFSLLITITPSSKEPTRSNFK